MSELKQKSFMSAEMLQRWANSNPVEIVSVTNGNGALMLWYCELPEKKPTIGGSIKKAFGK